MALTDEAILQITDMIRSGELAAGDRLPPEAEMDADPAGDDLVAHDVLCHRRLAGPAGHACLGTLLDGPSSRPTSGTWGCGAGSTARPGRTRGRRT